jgi:hypothetical protein
MGSINEEREWDHQENQANEPEEGSFINVAEDRACLRLFHGISHRLSPRSCWERSGQVAI